MPVWRYSKQDVDPTRTAKGVIRNAPISIKEAYEIFKVIRGMKLDEAEKLLERVIRKEIPIPYTRYKLSIAHKRQLPNLFPKWKTPIGRYPVKTAKYILRLIRNVRNNAEVKNLDTERLVIIHAAVHKGMCLKRFIPRAMGRSTPKVSTRAHLEMIVKEV